MDQAGGIRQLKRSVDNENTQEHAPKRLKPTAPKYKKVDLSSLELLPEELKWKVIEYASETIYKLILVCWQFLMSILW